MSEVGLSLPAVVSSDGPRRGPACPRAEWPGRQRTENKMIGRMLPRVARMAGALLALSAVLAVASGTASASQIYNNNVSPRNIDLLPSVGCEALSTAEFGGQVQFAGTPRTNATVTTIMSSWACQNLQGGAS